MKHIKIITLLIALISSKLTGCEAKIKNTKTETYKVWGNCGMCQETIEKAVKQKNTAKGKWNKDTKMIIISYDSIKTNSDAILKRIALAGYDNDKFIAPDEAYNKRPECCHYERKSLPISQSETKVELNENPKTEIINTPAVVETKTENQLKIIFEKYYEIKNALVKSDSKTASAKANDLVASINSIKMEDLTSEEHTVWMKVNTMLANDAGLIKANKDIAKQRSAFTTLSKNMYALIKVSKQQTTTY